MNELKQAGWIRGLEISTGLLAIILGVTVLAYPGWGVATLVVLLSAGLFFTGLRSISLVGNGSVSKVLKAVSVITGIVSLLFALLVLLFPGFALLTLLIFVSFGLIVYGLGRIILAYILKTANWLRGLMVAVGVVDVILSALVLVLPRLALLTFAVVLAVVLLLSGAEMIISGAIGRTWVGDMARVVEDEMGVKAKSPDAQSASSKSYFQFSTDEPKSKLQEAFGSTKKTSHLNPPFLFFNPIISILE